jgi:hypothetical protein
MFSSLPTACLKVKLSICNLILVTTYELIFYLSTKIFFFFGYSRDNNTREVQSPTFQGEHPRSSLNWLCLAMILLKVLVCKRGFCPGWCLGDVYAVSTRTDHCSLTFLFYNSFLTVHS